MYNSLVENMLVVVSNFTKQVLARFAVPTSRLIACTRCWQSIYASAYFPVKCITSDSHILSFDLQAQLLKKLGNIRLSQYI